MRNFILVGCALVFLTSAWIPSSHAKPDREKPVKKVVDADGDGYHNKRDCNDSNSSVYPGAPETCGNVDSNCDGVVEPCAPACTDSDGDGFAVEGGTCGTVDCNDADNSVHPGATETCGDTIDQDCSGADLTCDDTNPHAGLTYSNYPNNCLSCHETEANEMYNSTHYRWVGQAPDMVNNPYIEQGKLTNAVNSYCINIKGDWPVCGSCHVGRGKKPDDPTAGLENIDCLTCHNEEYAMARTRLDDGTMGVVSPTDSMVRNIHAPTRVNCLKCHATAGGGDGVKRGDLSLASGTNNDPHFDVHMNNSGSDLNCQQCHVFEAHKVIGKGSDLRPTDDLARGAEIECITCHTGKDSLSGHDNETVGRHVARVSCQTCHIPTYAKVATETHRDWRRSHDGSLADGVSGPGHPFTVKDSNLIPEYRFWNRMSDNVLLGDIAVFDDQKGTYPTSRPAGDIEDGKLYPFKYKTATQPMTSSDNRLIALDTFEYIKVSGNVETAIEKGLINMGYPAGESYEWIDTDTYQMLNHGVNPASNALQCSSCHGNTNQMDLQNELGYGLKAAENMVCNQCHGPKEQKPFVTIHDKHVKDKKYDCSWCHSFSRPERGLRIP
ncbi:MAG: MopE-related protein [Thermodesulfobacteriota bacterium]|nr:MopE-related protein [Thermodesulfobacteriota bacterium]